METPHIPVLLNEVLNSFKDVKEGYFVDCTLGYAGHSSEILKKCDNIKHIGIDRDNEALLFSKKRLEPFDGRSILYKGTFATVLPTLKEAPIMAILADFGVSSLQLDKKERGFSFASETLDMRMDASAPLSAYEVVNMYPKERLEYIFDVYGEVRSYRKLAGAVVEARSKAPIKSAKELAEIAQQVIPSGGKIHPATLMFQAIRIEVNNELGEIEGLLDVIEAKHYEDEIVSLITFESGARHGSTPFRQEFRVWRGGLQERGNRDRRQNDSACPSQDERRFFQVFEPSFRIGEGRVQPPDA